MPTDLQQTIITINQGAKEIDLTSAQIGDTGLEILASALEGNKIVRKINLCDNQISENGIKFLAEVFKTNETITEIDLSENQIRDDGLLFLVFALEKSKKIASIDLSGNEINDEGIKKISEFLKVNKSTSNINLCRNYIGNKGADLLIEALEQNKTITCFNLSLNELTDEKLQEIDNLLNRNISLLEELYEAAIINNVENIKRLISEGVAIDNDNKDEEGKPQSVSALYHAVSHNRLEAVKVLLELGADVNYDSEGKTPLFIALNQGYIDAAKLILDHNKLEKLDFTATKFDDVNEVANTLKEVLLDNYLVTEVKFFEDQISDLDTKLLKDLTNIFQRNLELLQKNSAFVDESSAKEWSDDSDKEAQAKWREIDSPKQCSPLINATAAKILKSSPRDLAN